MSKDIVNERAEIKCNIIIKQYKNDKTLMMLQKKYEKTYSKLATNS